MKILVITRNAWDDTNAIGNTISNFFDGIDNIEFANIYFRSSQPNNKVCKDYYRVTEKDILKNWFSPKKIGKSFTVDAALKKESSVSAKNEKKIIRFIQKYGFKVAYRFSDYLWYSEKWINENLDNFIEKFSPDIIFSFVKSAPQYYLTVKHLREKFNIPLLSWVADDEYSELLKNGEQNKIKNLQYILKESSAIKGCSEEICDYYGNVFGCSMTPLYKGCDFNSSVKDSVGNPIKIVYAGNLLYGRLEIISKISDIIEKYSSNIQSVSFDIYSNTSLMASEIQEKFGNKSFTHYKGRQDYNVIKEKLAKADIVLHVESFENDQILKTKYSFSTKIIDALQSGSVLLAVGPVEVASIRYIQKIPGAYVISNIETINDELECIFGESCEYVDRAKKIRRYAEEYHNGEENSKKTAETLKSVIGGNL